MKKLFSKAAPQALLRQVRRLGRQLRGKTAAAQPPARPVRRASVRAPAGTTIRFAAGSAVVRRQQLRVLARIAEYFLKSPYTVLVLEGHAGEDETTGAAGALAARRARAVRNWLRRFGVDPEAIRLSRRKPGDSVAHGPVGAPSLDLRTVKVDFREGAAPDRGRHGGAGGTDVGQRRGRH